MRKKSPHPPWAVRHRKPGTELKRISGRYYLYGAASEYDKITKKTKKKSLGILGSITEKDGFIPSPKAVLRESKSKPLAVEQVYAYEYGFSSWLKQRLEQSGIEAALQTPFPRTMEIYHRHGVLPTVASVSFEERALPPEHSRPDGTIGHGCFYRSGSEP